ncbi:hypothetical protein PGB90_002572 [Kerria lacca]
MELVCPVKMYHWGKVGLQSLVANLKKSSDESFQINHNETYAELWIGTHPNGPAMLKNNDILLEKWLLQHSHTLGEKVQRSFGNNLPFLLKILSIGTPLSIQVHPSKEIAKELHSKYPDIYKDSNHKPELAIALTTFEALCGFRPLDEIKKFFSNIPELSDLIGIEKVEKLLKSDEFSYKNNLKNCFESLIKASENIIKSKLELLLQRITSMDDSQDILGSLFIKIYHYYPGDVGCFCIYFFNYLILEPGEAIYLGSNEPHAYISGDCVECMACSDNVVRAGLTPKFRDVDTLCRIINYKCDSAKSKILCPIVESEYSVIFKPPVSEFGVCRICVEPGNIYNITPRESGSVFIIINGTAKIQGIHVKKGQIFFFKQNEELQVQVSQTKEPFLLFQAFVNI